MACRYIFVLALNATVKIWFKPGHSISYNITCAICLISLYGTLSIVKDQKRLQVDRLIRLIWVRWTLSQPSVHTTLKQYQFNFESILRWWNARHKWVYNLSQSTTKPLIRRATSEDSDQPAHPCSLIRVFADRMCLLQLPGYPKSDRGESLSYWWMYRLIWVFVGYTGLNYYILLDDLKK